MGGNCCGPTPDLQISSDHQKKPPTILGTWGVSIVPGPPLCNIGGEATYVLIGVDSHFYIGWASTADEPGPGPESESESESESDSDSESESESESESNSESESESNSNSESESNSTSDSDSSASSGGSPSRGGDRQAGRWQEIAKTIAAAQKRNVRHDAAEVAGSTVPFENEAEILAFALALEEALSSSEYPAGFRLYEEYESIESYKTGRSSKPLVIPLPYNVWFSRIVAWCKALDLLKRLPVCKAAIIL